MASSTRRARAPAQHNSGFTAKFTVSPSGTVDVNEVTPLQTEPGAPAFAACAVKVLKAYRPPSCKLDVETLFSAAK